MCYTVVKLKKKNELSQNFLFVVRVRLDEIYAGFDARMQAQKTTTATTATR